MHPTHAMKGQANAWVNVKMDKYGNYPIVKKVRNISQPEKTNSQTYIILRYFFHLLSCYKGNKYFVFYTLLVFINLQTSPFLLPSYPFSTHDSRFLLKTQLTYIYCVNILAKHILYQLSLSYYKFSEKHILYMCTI